MTLVEEVGTDMISVHDAAGVYLYASPNCQRLFGWEAAELIGRNAYELFHPEDIERITADHQAHNQNDREQGLVRYRLRCADGRYRVVETRSRPKLEQGQLRYIVCFTRDIHERDQLELEATQARSGLTSLGLVAASAAHELRTPLAYLLNNVEFVQRELLTRGAPAELTHALADALTGAERVRELALELLRFARPDDKTRQGPVADLRAAVDSAVRMTRAHVQGRATVDLKWQASHQRVVGNQWRISQILLNLIANAADAMPHRPAAENRIELITRNGDGAEVLVEVRDNGPGMSPEAQRRVFEPLFTTGHRDHFGLGLWICRTLSDALGAPLELESHEGVGTTFRLRLHGFSEESGPRHEPAAAAPRGPRHLGLRILVVDDEPLIGRALERALEPFGSVLVLTEAQPALEHLARTRQVDVLITDMVIGAMGGRELITTAERLIPGLARRSIMISGREPDGAMRAFLEQHGCTFLQKPFQLAQLQALVARLAEAWVPQTT